MWKDTVGGKLTSIVDTERSRLFIVYRFHYSIVTVLIQCDIFWQNRRTSISEENTQTTSFVDTTSSGTPVFDTHWDVWDLSDILDSHRVSVLGRFSVSGGKMLEFHYLRRMLDLLRPLLEMGSVRRSTITSDRLWN